MRTALMAARRVPYAGPGDIVSGATFFCGLRAYSAATCGTPCALVRRLSDSAQLAINSLGNGAFDIGSALAFQGASSLVVDELYDQTGNGNNFTKGENSPPLFLSGGPSSGAPYMQFVEANQDNLALAFDAFPNPGSLHAVVSGTNSSGATRYIIAQATTLNGNRLFFSSTSNDIGIAGNNASAVTAAAAFNAWHNVDGVIASGTNACHLYIDGTGTAGTSTPSAGSGAIYIGLYYQTFLFTTMNLVEFALWPLGLSSTQASAVNANAHSFWGF